MQNRTECGCGWRHGSLLAHVEPKYCSSPCLDDRTRNCGGRNFLSMYLISSGDIICEPGWYQFQDSCVYYSLQRLSWLQARDKCLEMDADLVMFLTKEKHEFLTNIQTSAAFIGANDFQQEGIFYWNDGDQLNISWNGSLLWENEEQPQTSWSEEDCVELYKSGELNDQKCNKERTFFCEKHKNLFNTRPIACDSGWLAFGENCYYLSANKKNWNDARKTCQEMNADLLSIACQNEFDYFHQTPFRFRNKKYWLGFRLNGTVHMWVDRNSWPILNVTDDSSRFHTLFNKSHILRTPSQTVSNLSRHDECVDLCNQMNDCFAVDFFSNYSFRECKLYDSEDADDLMYYEGSLHSYKRDCLAQISTRAGDIRFEMNLCSDANYYICHRRLAQDDFVRIAKFQVIHEDHVVLRNISQMECLEACRRNENFFCKSAEYDPTVGECRLSHSSASDPYVAVTVAVSHYFHRVMNVSAACDGQLQSTFNNSHTGGVGATRYPRLRLLGTLGLVIMLCLILFGVLLELHSCPMTNFFRQCWWKPCPISVAFRKKSSVAPVQDTFTNIKDPDIEVVELE